MIGAHIGPFSTSGGIAQAGLDFNFSASLYQKIDTDGTNMVRTSTLSDLITVSRASKKTNAGGWDFISGSAVGALTEVNNNEAARDSVKGLLVEESSTNGVKNPRLEGAVAGTPGTPPTNTTVSAQGTTTSIIGSGTEDGWPYVDIRWNGTPTNDPAFLMGYSTDVAASAGESWTASVGVKVVGGDMTNITRIRLRITELTSAPGFNKETYADFTLSSGNQRVIHSITAASGTAYLRPDVSIDWDGSGDIDVTLRIYAPQLEEKAYPTSPIFPPVSTPGAATRSADFAFVPAGAWAIDDAPCSLYVLAYMINGNKAGSFGRVVSFGQNSSNEAGLIFNATNNVLWSVRVGGTVQAVRGVTNTMAAGTELRTAIGLETNNIAISSNGVTQAVDTSGTINFGDSVLSINASPDAANRGTGCWIETIKLFPERLTNAQLEALVGN